MEINEQDDANKSSHSDGLLTETTTISTIKSTDENILKSSSYDVLPQKNENEKEIEIENDENKELVYNNNNNVDDTNVDVLTNKVPVADDENVNNNIKTATVNGDGSDSGVEIGVATNNNNNVLQRALSSSNSGGYTSSCGGIEDNIGPISCNSSMISYCSDTCDKTNSTVVLPDFYASEGGSESSSVTGDPTFRKLNSGAKKKVAVKEGNNKSPRRSNESNSSGKSSIRSRPPSVNRSQSLSIKSGVPSLMTRERARSRDKNKIENPTFISPQKSLMTTSLTRSMSLKRPPKPDSLSLMSRDTNNLSPRVNLSRTPSLTRGRTPHATPTNCDDGRWPSVGNKTATQTPRVVKTNNSAAATPTNSDTLIIRTRIGNIQLDNKSSTFDKYATLPRRRKERSVENLTQAGSRSSSTTRNNPDTLPNRMTNSVVKKLPSSSTPNKSLPAYPKIAKKPLVPKTKIYHETSVQTAITCKDVDDAFSGNPKNLPRIDAVEMKTKETQSDIRDKEMEKLREQIDKMNADHSQLLAKLSEKSQTVSELEQELLKEKEEKLIAQKELQNNTERVMHMLNNFQAGPRETEKEGDSLLMLESQLMISGSVLEKQQDEIVKLQNICRTLQRDMEKSLKIQENLIRQKNELEEESTELQDFLQAEKVAFMDALKEAENENRHVKEKLSQRESELERQQEECRHLVRICEQRRQEYLGMQAKYNALEGRSKDLLLSQGSAVSGANVALASLQSRIEHLVEQLISSYNISEQDLEVS
ncbi:hypothetical protein PVAND_006892 [Polypedilum vanderplanki]|uniref:Uncharacterized protein n=1 Tax=Polypedilum vanderplanki TaxID=319348 RepID=A0A9J6C5D1_POLVA|nr:hypothetical protein PVAND_006892 [Polypedilum vanderplanki]